MNHNLLMSLKVAIVAVLFAASFSADFAHGQTGNVIDIDTTAVEFGLIDSDGTFSPAQEAQFRVELAAACREAEAILEQRIIGYSTEVPAAVRNLLSTVQIRCNIEQIDGPGGILAFAGPRSMATITRTFGAAATPMETTLPIEGIATFDYADLEFLSTTNTFTQVAAHEILHATSFGFWEFSSLCGPVSGIGIDGYVGGQYAIPAFRLETDRPFANFIPLQQTENGVGGHWAPEFMVFDPAIGALRGDLMVPFLDAVNPGVFISESTFGVMADHGYAVIGFNEQLLAPASPGVWPKTTGGIDPFGPIGPGAAAGASFVRVQGRTLAITTEGGANLRVQSSDSVGPRSDPYNLRRFRWVR